MFTAKAPPFSKAAFLMRSGVIAGKCGANANWAKTSPFWLELVVSPNSWAITRTQLMGIPVSGDLIAAGSLQSPAVAAAGAVCTLEIGRASCRERVGQYV